MAERCLKHDRVHDGDCPLCVREAKGLHPTRDHEEVKKEQAEAKKASKGKGDE